MLSMCGEGSGKLDMSPDFHHNVSRCVCSTSSGADGFFAEDSVTCRIFCSGFLSVGAATVFVEAFWAALLTADIKI